MGDSEKSIFVVLRMDAGGNRYHGEGGDIKVGNGKELRSLLHKEMTRQCF